MCTVQCSVRWRVLESQARSVYLRLWAESRGPPSSGPPGLGPLTATVFYCPPLGEHLVSHHTVSCQQYSTVLQGGNI